MQAWTAIRAAATARVLRRDTSVPSVMPVLKTSPKDGTDLLLYAERTRQRVMMRPELQEMASSSPSHQSSNDLL